MIIGDFFRLAIVVTILSGCMTSEPDFARIINESEPVSSTMRASFGVIGVLPTTAGSYFAFTQPVSTGDAIATLTARGMVTAADVSFKSDSYDIGSDMASFGAGLVLAGVYGAVGGVLTGVPEADMRKAEKAMNLAIRDEPLVPGVLVQIQRLISGSPPTNFMMIPAAMTTNASEASMTNADYRTLAGPDVDSLLLFKLVNERFAPGKGSNPRMAVDINLNVRIIRVSDGAELFMKTLEYQGGKLQFTRWGADDAKLFRAELQVAQRTFAEAIFAELHAE